MLRGGALFEDGLIFGERGEGAFAGGQHQLVFGSAAKTFPIGKGETFALEAETLWAGGRLAEEAGLLKDAGGLYSQHSLALAYTPGGTEGAQTRVRLEQPLRAESGSAEFHRPVGRKRTGETIWRTAKAPLEPEAREIRVGLAHERPMGKSGRLALAIARSYDAGHVPGAREDWVGARLEIAF